MLEGDNKYFCEKCGKKVNTLKRACIQDLPNTLLVHLKRFEFDYDTMRKYKLNDCIEFPIDELDMTPYTKEVALCVCLFVVYTSFSIISAIFTIGPITFSRGAA